MATTQTVTFNVGGTIYQVSKSLLDLHSDTMLARLASPTWSQSDSDTPIFIERDGERFKYVLDYMRDNGSVQLPVSVAKEGVLNDLQYYGFENVDSSLIQIDLVSTEMAISALHDRENNAKRKYDKITTQLSSGIERLQTNLTAHKELYDIAILCFSHKMKNKKDNVVVLDKRDNNKEFKIIKRHIEILAALPSPSSSASVHVLECRLKNQSEKVFKGYMKDLGYKLQSVRAHGIGGISLQDLQSFHFKFEYC